MCQKAKANNGSPNICFQLLFYPALRLDVTVQSGGAADPAIETAFPLDLKALNWFHRMYVPEDVDPADPGLSPLFPPDLTGLPPAYTVTAGLAHLRADPIASAERLK